MSKSVLAGKLRKDPYTIDLSGIPDGFYFCSVLTDKQGITRKVIIAH